MVLLDLIMPGMDGYEVLEFMKERDWLSKIPVLVISTETSELVEERCFELGVSDFIRKPFANSQVRHRVKNIVTLFAYKNQLEKEVERQTKTVQRQYQMLQNRAEKLKQTNIQVIKLLGSMVEYRNLNNNEHIRCVKDYTRILAEEAAREYPEYGLTQQTIAVISAASALHDIGKIMLSDRILLKPGKLSEEEQEYMKSHTLCGCEIIDNIRDVWDENYRKICYEITRSHHERYDGNGYPDGLKEEEIPLSAQLVSIADIYDSLTSDRISKSAFSKEEAFRMIVSGEAGVFSPRLLECFRNVKKEFENLENQKH